MSIRKDNKFFILQEEENYNEVAISVVSADAIIDEDRPNIIGVYRLTQIKLHIKQCQYDNGTVMLENGVHVDIDKYGKEIENYVFDELASEEFNGANSSEDAKDECKELLSKYLGIDRSQVNVNFSDN